MITSILLFFLLLALAGFFSGVETGIYVLDPVRYHLRVRERNRFALYLWWLFRDKSKLITALLVGTNLLIFLATMAAADVVRRHFSASPISYQAIITTLVTAPLVLVFAEIVPKNLYRRGAETLVYKSSRALAVAYIIFYPATLLLSRGAYLINRIVGSPSAGREAFLSRSAVEHHILESAQEGAITEGQQKMVQRILKLSQGSLPQSMVPLERVTMVSESANASEIRAIAAKKRFTRLPVYSGGRENVVGVLNVFDVLTGAELAGSAASRMRPVVRIASTLRIDEALVALQTSRQPLGIVAGARGDAIGIVTVKDLLEEITGEIYVW
jgi:CBS domain containing-hemolysin-like protein